MNHFFATKNLTVQSFFPCEPWEFKRTEAELPSHEIRHNKDARQRWYYDKATSWQFYTAIEPANPNQRLSQENPARTLYAFVADYDIATPLEVILRGIERMKHKPQWIETSLSGKFRLIWLLPRPVPVDHVDFCRFLLQKAQRLLGTEQLAGLDVPAFETPSRLYCNGGVWQPTNLPMIAENDLQAFIVECGQAFNFVGKASPEMPIDEAEKAIRAKFPNFDWPGPFELETQGPSFWIPQSVSPLSAIVKKDGLFTFSAHADKPFYTWSDIIGPDAVKQYQNNAIAEATKDCYASPKTFYRKKRGVYVACEASELDNYLQVNCRLSNKPDKTGLSMLQKARNHIWNFNDVTGAAPYVFQTPGPMFYQGQRVLNTWRNNVMKPAEGIKVVWGDECIQFICSILDNFFDPKEQLEYFLAWWKYFYESALHLDPAPGQNVYLMGIAGVGKTLMGRYGVGASVGGFTDASEFMTGKSAFNSPLYEFGLWCIDDETLNDSARDQAALQAMTKKIVANTEMMYNKKYADSVMTSWNGRAIITSNLDYVSTRVLGSMDNSSGDKTNIFRCASVGIKFPSRPVTRAKMAAELPFFLRYLLDWEPPAHVERDSRFGFKRYHEALLLNQAYQGSKTAPCKELLVEFLLAFFKANPDKPCWRGTVTQLVRDVYMNHPVNDAVIRMLKLDQLPRYLELIHREALMDCTTETGSAGTRIWVFNRFGDEAPVPAVVVPQSEITNFAK